MAVRARVSARRFPSSSGNSQKLRLCQASLILAVTLFALPAFPQRGGSTPAPAPQNQGLSTPMSGSSANDNPDNTRRGVSIRVTIQDSNKQPLKQQSLVRVTNQNTGHVFFQTTKGTEARFGDLAPGKYLIEVGAAGYIAAHQEINIPDLAHDISENFQLTRDPAAVNLSLGDEPGMPSKVRKQAEKGVQALELGNFVEARKYLEAANRQYPTSPTLSFLLAYVAQQQKEEDRELQYLLEATKLDPHNLQAQNLLGQLYYRRGDYTRAAESEAVVVEAQRGFRDRAQSTGELVPEAEGIRQSP